MFLPGSEIFKLNEDFGARKVRDLAESSAKNRG
jgi:hypothetical protein